jgi:hypothetical protein
VCPNFIELNEAINRPQQMLLRYMPLERKLVEERVLLDLTFPHHRPLSSRRNLKGSGYYIKTFAEFFNTICRLRSFA